MSELKALLDQIDDDVAVVVDDIATGYLVGPVVQPQRDEASGDITALVMLAPSHLRTSPPPS